MVSVMKSPNITSTTGRMPVMAAPTPIPAYPGSEIGVSTMRSVPNSCTSPTSVLNGWPASATSSPMRNTRGSRRISSAIASRTASPYVSSRTAVSVVAILGTSRAPRLRQVQPGVKNRRMGVVGRICCIQFSALTATWRYGAMTDGEDSMAVTLRRRRFTLDEYHRMGETGILGLDDRVELIEGEIIEMSPIGSRHAATVTTIQHLFSRRLGERALVWVQNPLRLTQYQSEPVPDVMLLAPRADFYAGGLPEPRDVRLLVEVADSSLAYDRRLEIHRGAGYRDVRIPRTDETFSAGAFADLPLMVRDLLG